MSGDQKCFRAVSKVVLPGMGYRFVLLFDELMDGERLRKFLPSPTFIGVGYYESRRWIINSSGRASILPRRGHRVYGTVWKLHEIEVAALDMHYGVPEIFERYGSFATFADGRRCTSEFYSARDRQVGAVDPEYLRQVTGVGRQLEFPDSYLEELSAWTSPQDVSIAAALRAPSG
jgi:hypothetical protein